MNALRLTQPEIDDLIEASRNPEPKKECIHILGHPSITHYGNHGDSLLWKCRGCGTIIMTGQIVD